MWDNDVIAQLISSVASIEQELGLQPEGVYASVRTRLDILEARINNPFSPSPNVTNPFYIGGSPISGVSIQDGYGDPNVAEILAVPGSLYLREDGYNNQGLYAFRPDGYWHLVDTDPWTAAGDLSGTIYSQTVIGLQGNPISSAAPSTGNTLSWSGAEWQPATLNLAGGSQYVTGQLPPANLGVITLTGDVVGSAAGGTITTQVAKINGTTVPSSPTANQVLVATSGTSAVWQQILDAQVSASANINGSKVNLTSSAGMSQNIVTTGNVTAANLSTTANITATGSISGNSFTSTTSVTTSTLAASSNATVGGTLGVTGSITGGSVVSNGNITLAGTLLWNSTPKFGLAVGLVMADSSYTVPSGANGYASFILPITSSVSLTATRNVVLPLTAGSAWLVYNNTSGGANIQVIGSSGTGYIIGNGNSRIVWTDGTNFYGTA